MRKLPWALRKRGLYRPTVVMVVINSDNQVLFVAQKKRVDFSFPQGGIELGESVREAAYREIKEEVRICRKDLTLLSDKLFSWIIDMPMATPQSMRGFKLGKAYFGVLFRYTGSKEITINKKEISAYRWASPKRVKAVMKDASYAKKDMAMWALRAVDNYLHSS